MNKFKILVTGRNLKEFEMRINDNIKRGFKVCKTSENETNKEMSKRIGGGYNSPNEIEFKKLIAYMEK